MNKLFTKITSRALGAAMMIGVGVAVSSQAKNVNPAEADTATMEYTGSSTTNMTASGNASTVGLSSSIFTVNSTKQGNNFPGLNKSGYIALYAGGSSTITVSVSSAYTINSITISYTSSTYSPATVLVGSSEVTGSSNTYTISSTSFVLKNAKSSGQVRMTSVEINYSSSLKTMTIDVGDGYVYARKTAQIVAKEGNTVLTGVTWDTSNHSVATIDSSGVLTGVANGQCNITASKTGYTTATAYTFYVYANNIVISPSLSGVSQFRTGETITASNISVEYLEDSGDEGTLTSSQYKINGTLASSFSYTFLVGDIGTKNFTISPVVDSTVEETLAVTVVAAGNVYSITTEISNGTYSGDTQITDNGGTASVTIAPTGDYKLPTSVSVSGAAHTYESSTGVISLSSATGNVTISAAMVALTEYSITVNQTNGTHTGATTIKESRSATITFTPASGYGNPSSVTVSGATPTWTRDTGVLSLSNPTGNVTVTYEAVGNELDSISISANSGSYTLGDNFVMPTVTAKYTVNPDADVTSSASYSGYDPFTTGNQAVTISYTEGGITKTASYTANVSAKSVGYSYNKISLVSDITEGDYILAYSSYAFNGKDANNGYTSVTITNDSIAQSTATDKLALHITPVTGGYTLQVSSTSDDNPGKYLGFTSGSNSLSFNANAVTIASQTVSSSTHYTHDSGGAFTFGDSSTVLSWNNNSSNLRYRFYKTSTTSDSTNGKNYYAFDLYKKVSSGSSSLIRITASYSGGEKYVGDPISASDFTVAKQLNTGTQLIPLDSGWTIDVATLASTSNNVLVSYTENNITKSALVVVPATERSATLEEVVLSVGAEAKLDGYVAWSGATWNLNDIKVQYIWSDSEYDTEETLQTLVDGGEATISPATPTLGATSFTVTYSYLEVSLTNNVVTLDEAVRSDYITSMSWGNTTAAHFKHFSGEQLTEEIVNTWHVKATYAGAGEGERLYWGDYDLYIGNKQITSLPYAWTTADDGETLSIHFGEDIDGNEFVKTNNTAVGNICATINAINHDETHSGTLEKVATWTKEQSAEIYDGGSNLTELCDNGVDIDTNIHMQGDSTAGSTAIRFWSDGIRCYNGNKLTFTPKNGAVITKITFASNGISFEDGVTDSSSSPFTINDGYGDSAITLSFSLNSTVKMGSDVVVEYQIEGSETTTVHYANQMEHFDAQKAVVTFAKFMNTTMNGSNVCSGTFANLESAWGDVADKYDELFGTSATLDATELAWAKHMLEYATANWGSDEEVACVEKAMKTYEHCVAKYELDPFMAEFRSVSKTNLINPIIDAADNAPVIVTVIVSMIGLSAVGGFFFLRKRKEI